jgi:hypothetical protein
MHGKTGTKAGLDASFDNRLNWKGIWKKAGGVNSVKAYITNDGTSC